MKVFLALALTLALPELFSPALASQAGGKIVIDQKDHDFGKVAYGDKASHTFLIMNSGKEPLLIKKVDVDCGCTKAIKGDSAIPPNGKSEIRVEFDSEGQRSGKVEKSVYIHSSDASAPDHGVKLTLSAEVVRDLELYPPTFAKTLLKFEETVSVPIKIKNSSGTSRTITAVHSSAPSVIARLESDKTALAPGTTIPLNVVLHLKPNSSESFYKGKILLETDHPREKQIDVRFLIRLPQS